MALDNIITKLQPANNNTVYDIGVFADKVFLGNDLDESNTLASMLNRYITSSSNGNICIDGYDDNNNGSIISKGSINTIDVGYNLQSLLFTDMIGRHQTFGIGGNKKSLIFGEGYGSVSNPNTAFGLNNSFIFGIDNNIKCNTSGGNYPSMSSYLDNPLLSNCGVIGSGNKTTCYSTTPTSVAKNSLIVGTNNKIISYSTYVDNTLIFGKKNIVETNSLSYNLEAFCAGSNNTIKKSGNVIGNGLTQNNIEVGGTVVGTYNSYNDVGVPIGGALKFEVGTGHKAIYVGENDVRETGFGVGEDNVIYMYAPNNGPVYAFTPTAGGLTLTAWKRNGELITSTNLLSLS